MARPLLRVLPLVLVAACSRDRNALRIYLGEDLPRMTAGLSAIVDAFHGALASDAPVSERLRTLDEQVIAPYARLVGQRDAYAPPREVVARHHRAYREAAAHQLAAMAAAREALAAGRPLREVAGMLAAVRGDLERWLAALRADAERLEVTMEPGS